MATDWNLSSLVPTGSSWTTSTLPSTHLSFCSGPSAESTARHRCPLFSRRTFVGLDTLCIDEMRPMHLGAFAFHFLTTFWSCIKEDVWHTGSHESSALCMRGELFAWYELDDFSLKHIGTADSQHLQAKAAQTGTLQRLAFELSQQRKDELSSGKALVEAGRALITYMHLTRENGLVLLPTANRRLIDCCLQFLTLREAAGISHKPKLHLMVHLVWQTIRFGNPRLVAVWIGETLNMHLVDVCRTALFCRRVLATFAHSRFPTALKMTPVARGSTFKRKSL